jgi:hypothetical protein
LLESVQYTFVASPAIHPGDGSPVASQTELGATHPPPTHASPAAQAFPQPPQLAGSVWVVTHALPHAVHPGWQAGVQVELTHTATASSVDGEFGDGAFGHTCPQPPQLFASLVVSTQAKPQAV